jgi:hypothetical protein
MKWTFLGRNANSANFTEADRWYISLGKFSVKPPISKKFSTAGRSSPKTSPRTAT